MSLLRDCYVAWPNELVLDLSEQHRAKYHAEIQPEQWQHWFDLTGMQRHLKAAGIFARLHHRDGKSHYLADIPRTLAYVSAVCQHIPQLNLFGHFLNTTVMPLLNHHKSNKEEA